MATEDEKENRKSLQLYFDKVDEVPEDETSIYEFLYEQFNQYFTENIPVEQIKELPTIYLYSLGCLAYSAWAVLFIVFFIQNYNSNLSDPYISLQYTSGSCSTVAISITGQYLVDGNGNWIGSAGFAYLTAAHELVLSNYRSLNTNSFSDMIHIFSYDMALMGLKAKTQNLPLNLLIWMSYIKYYSVEFPGRTDFNALGYGQVQYMDLTGNAAVVYDKDTTYGSISGVYGLCSLSSNTAYDAANAQITSTYNITKFTRSSNCYLNLIPTVMDYAPNGDDFYLRLDVRSFSTAMTVNMGYISISDLYRASNLSIDFTFNGADYTAGEYFDIRYSLMKSIYCVQNTSAVPETYIQSFCVLRNGFGLSLPVYNHFGANFTASAEYCDCNIPGVGNSTACNEFQLMSGLVFYRDADDYTFTSLSSFSYQSISLSFYNQIKKFMSLLQIYPNYASFNRASYLAAYHSSQPIVNSSDNIHFSSNYTALKEAFQFCNVTEIGVCSLINFLQIDPLSTTISDTQFGLNTGSCTDSMSIEPAALEAMSEVSPVSLTESYYDCYTAKPDAALNALGVASGNTSLAMVVLVIAIWPLLFYILTFIKQVPPREEYTAAEKKQAQEALAIVMLRLRDGKQEGIPKRGILSNMTKELMHAAAGGVSVDSYEEDNNSIADDSQQQQQQQQSRYQRSPPSLRRQYSTTSSIGSTRGRRNSVPINRYLQCMQQQQLQQQPTNSRANSGTPKSFTNLRQYSRSSSNGSFNMKRFSSLKYQQQSSMKSDSIATTKEHHHPTTTEMSPNIDRNKDTTTTTIPLAMLEEGGVSTTTSSSSHEVYHAASAAATVKTSSHSKLVRPRKQKSNRGKFDIFKKPTTGDTATTVLVSNEDPVVTLIDALYDIHEVPINSGIHIFNLSSDTADGNDAISKDKMSSNSYYYYHYYTGLPSLSPVTAADLPIDNMKDIDKLVKDLQAALCDCIRNKQLQQQQFVVQKEALHNTNNSVVATPPITITTSATTTTVALHGEAEEGICNSENPSSVTALLLVDNDDSNVGAMKENMKQAELLAHRLQRVNIELILRSEDDSYCILLQIANALCMHASLMMDVDMKDIALLYNDQIAYNVGGKLVTYLFMQESTNYYN